MTQARVLYDFVGESENEISIREGNTVTVLNEEISGGWWFGRNMEGQEGMFPSAYVEKLPSEQQQQLPAPPPAVAVAPLPGWTTFPDAFSDNPNREHRISNSSWGDEWNSTDEDSASSSAPQATAVAEPAAQFTVVQKSSFQSNNNEANKEKKSFTLGMGKIPTFGKSGAFDNYLVGAIESSATIAAEAITILDNGSGSFCWAPRSTSYTCTIGVPKKGAKFGGFKAYMAYPVTPSFNNIQVSRRYKHFDWLYERLTAKYGAVIAIPPLPDKQMTGRFEEELIEIRRIQLQSFTDRICRHPVLSESAVWKHFITETDERRWTSGKRKAESDILVGPAFLTTLQTPEIEVADDGVSEFGATLEKVEMSVKNMFSVTQEQSSRCRGSQKKDVQSVGQAFTGLATCLNTQVPALAKIGGTFETLVDTCETQASRSWDPLAHMLHDYKGLISSWGDIFNSYNAAKDRQKELESGPGEKEKIASRPRIYTYRIGILAEQNHFVTEVEADLNQATQSFVHEQITHYKTMASRMETLYSECWSDGANAIPAANLPLPPSAVQAPPATTFSLDPWNESNIYEEMP